MIEKSKLFVYPEIGEVKIIDIIDEYDFPIVYIADDKFKTHYLFQVVSNFNNELKTVAIKITEDSLIKIKTDEFSIQDVYRNPDDDSLYFFIEKDGQIKFEKKIIEEAVKLGLTSGDSYFGTFDKKTMQNDSAIRNATLTNKPTFDFVFDGPQADYPSMDAKKHVDIVSGFIDLLGSVSSISDKMMFSMRPGSVKLRFELEPTLFSGDESIVTINKISSLFKQNDKDILGESLEFDNNRIGKFDTFLKTISKIESSKVKFDFASPDSLESQPIVLTEEDITLKRDVIKQIKEQIDTGEIVIIGTLTAADKNNKTLKIIDDKNDSFLIKFDKNYENHKFVINETYNITVLAKSYKLTEHGYFKKKYELISIN